MNYCGLNKNDTSNGPGVRVSLFVSGCTLKCKGCFNPDSWDFEGGKPLTEEVVNEIIKAVQNKWISGFSILGGDPFEPRLEPELEPILKRIKEETGKSIWAWTGRRYEKLQSKLLRYIDVLVDGPFVEKKKVEGKWYGSSNQRIIELRK